MSGRIGALNTAGSGWVDPQGVPSAPAIETVGRLVIFAALIGFGRCCRCRRRKGDCSSNSNLVSRYQGVGERQGPQPFA